MEGASAAGIETDVYWFSQAVSVEEAEEEAAYVLNLISPYTVGTVAFDMEIVSDHDRIQGLNAEEKTAIAAAFCRVMKEALFWYMGLTAGCIRRSIWKTCRKKWTSGLLGMGKTIRISSIRL